MTEPNYKMMTLKERDAQLEELWAGLEDIPVNPDTEKLECFYFIWPAGTDKEEIWHWFDERHSKGITYLLYGHPFWEATDTLYEYVKKEIPYRFEDIYGIENVSPEIIQECVDSFMKCTYEDVVQVFNERMDAIIEKVLDAHGIEY